MGKERGGEMGKDGPEGPALPRTWRQLELSACT
jgi:hypothetical protein